MSVRWLLALGSNHAPEQRLADARAALAALGEVVETSAIAAGDDISGRGARYLNQWLVLASGLDEADLAQRFKAIERDAGRTLERQAQGRCDLDIDLLARLDGDGMPAWRARKPLAIPALRGLLEARFGDAIARTLA